MVRKVSNSLAEAICDIDRALSLSNDLVGQCNNLCLMAAEERQVARTLDEEIRAFIGDVDSLLANREKDRDKAARVDHEQQRAAPVIPTRATATSEEKSSLMTPPRWGSAASLGPAVESDESFFLSPDANSPSIRRTTEDTTTSVSEVGAMSPERWTPFRTAGNSADKAAAASSDPPSGPASTGFLFQLAMEAQKKYLSHSGCDAAERSGRNHSTKESEDYILKSEAFGDNEVTVVHRETAAISEKSGGADRKRGGQSEHFDSSAFAVVVDENAHTAEQQKLTRRDRMESGAVVGSRVGAGPSLDSSSIMSGTSSIPEVIRDDGGGVEINGCYEELKRYSIDLQRIFRDYCLLPDGSHVQKMNLDKFQRFAREYGVFPRLVNNNAVRRYFHSGTCFASVPTASERAALLTMTSVGSPTSPSLQSPVLSPKKQATSPGSPLLISAVVSKLSLENRGDSLPVAAATAGAPQFSARDAVPKLGTEDIQSTTSRGSARSRDSLRHQHPSKASEATTALDEKKALLSSTGFLRSLSWIAWEAGALLKIEEKPKVRVEILIRYLNRNFRETYRRTIVSNDHKRQLVRQKSATLEHHVKKERRAFERASSARSIDRRDRRDMVAKAPENSIKGPHMQDMVPIDSPPRKLKNISLSALVEAEVKKRTIPDQTIQNTEQNIKIAKVVEVLTVDHQSPMSDVGERSEMQGEHTRSPQDRRKAILDRLSRIQSTKDLRQESKET